MAKTFEEPYGDAQKIFDAVMESKSLKNSVKLKVLCDDSMKKVVGKVVKANDVTKHLSGIDVVVIINMEIFDGLTVEQQVLAAEELITGIHYEERENRSGALVGKVVINKPDVNTYSGLLQKHGYDVYEVLQESVKSLYDAKKDREAGA